MNNKLKALLLTPFFIGFCAAFIYGANWLFTSAYGEQFMIGVGVTLGFFTVFCIIHSILEG